jgi:hypothetical protein
MRLLLILLSACLLAGVAPALAPHGKTGARDLRLLIQGEPWLVFATDRSEWRNDAPVQFSQAQQEDRRHTCVPAPGPGPRGAGTPAVGRAAADTPCSL